MSKKIFSLENNLDIYLKKISALPASQMPAHLKPYEQNKIHDLILFFETLTNHQTDFPQWAKALKSPNIEDQRRALVEIELFMKFFRKIPAVSQLFIGR
jgi:hypothetical protein